MLSKPKPPQPVPTVASTPAAYAAQAPVGNPITANYSGRGASRASMGQRPNKLLRPYTGAMSSNTARPTLLGG